jgi:hypothetical protein
MSTHQRLCVVPEHVIKDAYHGISRQGKRITLIACLAANGSYLKPASIFTRSTSEDELASSGFANKKIEVCSQRHVHIDMDMFTD